MNEQPQARRDSGEGSSSECDALARAERAERALARSQEFFDGFTHIVGHDLRAPLRGVRLVLDFIEEDLEELPAELGPRFEQMRTRIDRMEVMLAALLRLARAGRLPRESVEVELAPLVSRVLGEPVPGRDFEIELLGLSTVRAPTLVLEHVLSNLLENALLHHDRSRPRLSVVARVSGDGQELEIRDDGPGIDPRHHERIFQPFQALGAGAGQSSGMGLAIVRHLVGVMGGEVVVRSPLSPDGRGSAFVLSLP